MIKLRPLISELTQYQKERKKDYLFRQSKMTSSNTIPSFEKVWEELKRSDDFQHEIEWRIESNVDMSQTELNVIIREEQYERYTDIVYQYEQLDGEYCWRNMTLHKSIDPRTLNQLGIYWAIEENAAEAHWGIYKNDYIFDCTYEALIELKNVDWPGTIFSRMAMSGGDDEQEIRFLKNAPLLVRKVEIVNTEAEKSETYFINNRRRA